MENKLKVWIVRDEENGNLNLYFSHPLKGQTMWWILDLGINGVGGIRLDSNLFPSVKWEDKEPTEAYITLAEPQSNQEQPNQEQEIDWEQRHYEIVKDILSTMFCHPKTAISRQEYIDFAVKVADTLISTLKNKNK